MKLLRSQIQNTSAVYEEKHAFGWRGLLQQLRDTEERIFAGNLKPRMTIDDLIDNPPHLIEGLLLCNARFCTVFVF